MAQALVDCVQTAIAAIGTEIVSEEFRTSSHRLAQFAAATGAQSEVLLSGRVAVPTFAHVPVMQSMVEVLGRVTGALMLHGEHDFRFLNPIVPVQRLFSRSRLTGVRSNPAGLLLIVRSDTWQHHGDVVCTQYSTCILTGKAAPVAAGEAVPQRPQALAGAGDATSFDISPRLTEAYADAARDYSAYCLDPEFALAAGFPAPIVYGMLSLSLAAIAVIDTHASGDPTRLRRIGCRFAQPLYSRADERLVIEHAADPAGLIAFGASDGQGRTIMTRGYAEVMP